MEEKLRRFGLGLDLMLRLLPAARWEVLQALKVLLSQIPRNFIFNPGHTFCEKQEHFRYFVD